ncbi:MAG TPA: hypothetical protein VEI01_22365 [Terriglobales bacterium]|nr:hypothetical protein [Terriglobales bacterium]
MKVCEHSQVGAAINSLLDQDVQPVDGCMAAQEYGSGLHRRRTKPGIPIAWHEQFLR